MPQEFIDIAWKAQKRLDKRCWARTGRGKRPQTTVAALARELVGFNWAIGRIAPQHEGTDLGAWSAPSR